MNYSTEKVAYPKLTLYAFHLYKNLADDSKPVKNSTHLWKKCQEIGKKLGIPKLESLSTSENQQVSNEDFIKFTAIKHQDNHLNGEINRLLIHDTYALDLTFRYPQKEVVLTDLTGLNQDNCLLASNINASLGQTLVFFAQPVGIINDEKAFADACVKALISESEFNKLNLSCQGKGKLLNSSIFEYNNNSDSPQEQCHILIWLNTNQETTDLENYGEYYYPLIELLNCRHKIIYARSESRWCYQQARKKYSNLEEKVNLFNNLKDNPADSKLKEFNQWLNEIPAISFEYSRYLRDLELQRNTIQTNLRNYKIYLEKLKAIWIKDDLEFLSSFSELAEDTFIEQINTDLAYLTPAQSLFEQLIESIRGIVEIEQTKRDRNLNTTINTLGIGFGGGAIISGVVVQHIDKIKQPVDLSLSVNKPLHPFYASLFISIAATLCFCFIGWLISRRR
ncbi:hypothetical protein Riv7116_0867 [Rivularia sp. PCC 7116]|uniref:hypothetical protein n=1 Tax=Rivularia sp. PCC 7116 TaxID=373994 RepID=UPI00029EFAAA|nr:hypothetical protein [Rivularia sp. PCC 7116]AFY53448.1 hypothetical protein Riv7116_0867 [Rivularia sp. PCC 7116]